MEVGLDQVELADAAIGVGMAHRVWREGLDVAHRTVVEKDSEVAQECVTEGPYTL